MKKRNMNWKKLLSAMAVAVSAVGIAGVSLMANAASQPEESRGYVNVDIDQAVLVDKSTGKSNRENRCGLDYKQNNNEWFLYYENDGWAWEKDDKGVTYRTKDTYNLTDVESIGIWKKQFLNILIFLFWILYRNLTLCFKHR